MRENARSQFKAILADIQRIVTPLPDVCEIKIRLENLLRERTSLRKLDSIILDLVDEELEDEIEHADLYADCFGRTKAFLSHFMNCGKRGVLPEVELPDHWLRQIIAKIADSSAHSRTKAPDVIHSGTSCALLNHPRKLQGTARTCH